MHVGSLGDVVFESSADNIFTPSQAQLAYESRFEDHQIQGGYEYTEFLAPSLGTVSLSIHLRRDLMNEEPVKAVGRLMEMQRKGQIVRLILNQVNLGKFTVRKVDFNWNGAMKNASGPLSMNVNLELREYYD